MTVSRLTVVDFLSVLLVTFSSINSILCTGNIGNFYYGENHPMKPHRIHLTNDLLLNYGVYQKMKIYASLMKHFGDFKAVSLFTVVLGSLKLCVWFFYQLLQSPLNGLVDMTNFHSAEYVQFLKSITPDNVTQFNKERRRCR